MSLFLPTRRHLLLGSDGYLLNEPWNGSAVNLGRWALVDSGSKISVSSGRLRFSGGVGTWGDPLVVATRSYQRRAGLTFEFETTPSANTLACQVGVHTSTPVDHLNAHGFHFDTDGTISLVRTTGLLKTPTPYTGGTSYWQRLVLKATGALYYWSTDAGVTWSLIGTEDAHTGSPLYPYFQNNDATSAPTHDFVRVYQRSIKTAVVSDTFTRDDSALTLGSAETGQAYMAPDQGTYGVSSNRAYSVTDANGDQVRLESGVADGIFECVVNGTLNSGSTYRQPVLLFRANSQYVWLAAGLVAGNLNLYKDDGVGSHAISILASVATTTADNTDYTLRAVCNGNVVNLYVDGAYKLTHTLAGGDTKYAAYTQLGLYLAKAGAPATAARWDGLSVQAGIP